MARSIARIITSLTLGLALVAAPVISATAAQAADVTISKIGTKKAKKGKTVTIKPVVKTAGDRVKVTAKTLTVTKGKKKVAADAKSAKLKIGTYKVTQKVTYRAHVGKSKTLKRYSLVTGDCTLTEIIKNRDDIWVRAGVSCTSDQFPGTQTFVVDWEWFHCGVEEFYDDICDVDQYFDDDIWWEGYTTDKKLSFDVWQEERITPAVGDTFYAWIYVEKGTWTVRDDQWSELKTKTRTQTLKVKKK